MLSGNRQKFSSWEKRIGKNLSFMSANVWTAISVISGLITAYMIAQNLFIPAAIFFALTALCDAIDGAVARYKKTASIRGAYLDTIIDRYVEFFVIAGLFFAAIPSLIFDARLWLFIYMFGAMMTTYAKAAAKEKGLVQQEIRHGIMERAERMLLLFIAIALGSVSPLYTAYLIAILATLSNITALQRITKAFRG